nr:hypothetical protein [Tanacetum cinerariifolium]
GSTTGSQSGQQSVSKSAYAEEPVQTTCQMEETQLPVYETDTLTTDLLAGPTYELIRGSCSSLTELEYHLE